MKFSILEVVKTLRRAIEKKIEESDVLDTSSSSKHTEMTKLLFYFIGVVSLVSFSKEKGTEVFRKFIFQIQQEPDKKCMYKLTTLRICALLKVIDGELHEYLCKHPTPHLSRKISEKPALSLSMLYIDRLVHVCESFVHGAHMYFGMQLGLREFVHCEEITEKYYREAFYLRVWGRCITILQDLETDKTWRYVGFLHEGMQILNHIERRELFQKKPV